MTTVEERFTVPVSDIRDEWLQAREPYWNASYAGCLFGVHPWVTFTDACVMKLTGHAQEETAAMRRGTAMEPYIADEASHELDLELIRPPDMYGRGVLLSTLDRAVADDPMTHVEIKSTTERVGDDCPPYWHWQAQAQMWCYGSEKTVIAYLDPRLEVGYLTVERNESDIALLVERAEEAMAAISFGELPEGMDLTASNIDMLYPEDDGEIALAPPTYAGFVLDYVRATDAIKAWEEIKRKARDKIVTAIGPASGLSVLGVNAATYKATRGGVRFDMEAFAADHPELVEKYQRFRPGGRRIYVPKSAAAKLMAMSADRQMAEEQEEEL